LAAFALLRIDQMSYLRRDLEFEGGTGSGCRRNPQLASGQLQPFGQRRQSEVAGPRT
jgi:hypothetical protein